MTTVEIRGLRKEYPGASGPTVAIENLHLDLPEASLVTLVGPSGCGKTTTLRCLAGLEVPTRGRIVAGDRVLVDSDRGVFLPPERREMGMVFQSYALWPHMSVFDNVAFPLRTQRIQKSEVRNRVVEVLSTVGLRHLGGRYPAQLSGGQQQRAALARALVASTELILFDEPLSNLDAKLRVEMRGEIRRLHEVAGGTSVYVTHDREEALSLSDLMIVMAAGRIVQMGSPREVYARPRSAFVADFMGVENVLAVNLSGHDSGASLIEADQGCMVSLASGANYQPNDPRQEWLTLRASELKLLPPGDGEAGHRISGQVKQVQYLGQEVLVIVEVFHGQLSVRVSAVDPAPNVGDPVDVDVPKGVARLIRESSLSS